MTPVLPSLPFPAALLRGGSPVTGTPWLIEALADARTTWLSAEGRPIHDGELPWRRPEPWHGALALRRGGGNGAPPPLRYFQAAGVRFDEEQWLWQFIEEEDAAAQARAVARAITTLPDSLTVSTAELISAASEWAAVIDALPQMIVLTNLEGRITRCNEAFRRFTCLPFGSLTGRPLAHVLGGATAPPLPEEYYSATTSAVLCPRAGWLLVRGFPIHRNAQLRAWVHALEEISPSRLTASGHRPLIAIEQASDGIALVDAELRVEYANSALAELLQLPRCEVHGKSAAQLGLLPEGAGAEAALLPVLRSGEHSLRVERTRGQHTGVLELSIGPVINAGGEVDGFALIARDVADRERGLRHAEIASATSDLCHWLGGLRHELGNPINSVKMALTVLHSHLAELTPAEVVRYVERALSELGRVEYLLRSLKTFTLFDPPELQRVDMGTFVESTVASLEPTLARQGIALERIDGAPGASPLIATADPRALHQVTMSLVNNAAEALGGKHGRIQIGAVRNGGAIELNVHDTGPGIAPAQVERLFLPFETTKRGNPGLGLTLVRRLVTAMHGTVSIESALGVGTRVRVRLDEVR